MATQKTVGRDYPLSPTPEPMRTDNTSVSKVTPNVKKLSLIPKATEDSTSYYGNKEYISKLKGMTADTKPEMDARFKESDKAKEDRWRQKNKGQSGYDENGFPFKK